METPMATAYQSLVADDQCTRQRPAQWEGHLADGRHFAFTYRQGQAHLTINPGTAAYQTVSVAYGGNMASVLSEDEYHSLFVRLAAQMAEG